MLQLGHEFLHVSPNSRKESLAKISSCSLPISSDVAGVSYNEAKDMIPNNGHTLPVIFVSGSNGCFHYLHELVDNDMELEAVEPAHGALALGRNTPSDFVAKLPFNVTNAQLGAIHRLYNIYPSLLPKEMAEGFEEPHSKEGQFVNSRDKVFVRWQLRKVLTVIRRNMPVEIFPITVCQAPVFCNTLSRGLWSSDLG